MNNKFLFMLGLCRKAGKMIIGTDLVTKSLPSKKTYLVIYTSDASGNTKKRVTDKCSFYGVECIETPLLSSVVSDSIGKTGSVCVIGITDLNFASELKSLNKDSQ
ncbi:MAG: ribosomal L7Ae/L30e/S12e/Gadd45 family protein [Clostridia bacterium]|jgi:ribosomal protein L7Ae-like RNA K-turn-binding protein|nr:ribosomal L7Ae/L30e/S12e/Gadd45 family protein [Clostridia bacterium]